MAARRDQDLLAIHDQAEELAHATRVMILEQKSIPPLKPCNHFMVVNGHCIDCHEVMSAEKN